VAGIDAESIGKYNGEGQVMAHSNAKRTISLLQEYGFKFSKSMGQNFLVDENIPEKIVAESGIDNTCGVVEIGPGPGALTVVLGRVASRVLAIELDWRLVPILEDVLDDLPNVDVIQGDVMKMDIAQLVGEKMPDMRLHVCSNLPYNITTPVITKLIDSGAFETITVMVQREVGRRMSAAPGRPEYGAFTVFLNYHTESVKSLFDVPPECFMPRPSVYSSVVTMKTRQSKLLGPDDEIMFFSVVRAAFAQRRKMLLNALHSAFGNELSKEAIADIISECGFSTSIRGETLGVPEFIKLAAGFTGSSKVATDQ